MADTVRIRESDANADGTAAAGGRPPRRWLTAAITTAVVVVLLIAAAAALRAGRDGVLPGLELAGREVGGMSRVELAGVVDDIAAERAADRVTVELRDTRRTATNADIGYSVDRDATIDAAWRRGRQGNPLTAVGDHVRGTFSTVAVGPVERLDAGQLDAWARETADELRAEPVEGDVSISGASVRTTVPEPGARPDPDALAAEAGGAVLSPGSETLDVEAEPIAPRSTTDDVERVAAAAETVLSAPVELYRRDDALTLGPEALAELYEVRPPTDDVGLHLTLDDDAVDELFAGTVEERFTAEPREATIELVSGGPRVREGRNGFTVTAESLAEQIDRLARTPADEGERRERLEVELVEPDRTTAEARELQVTERVSSFTTEHRCCQGRVTNIQRFADLVDGALIEPGETFSLNGHVGQRTAAKGFVGGGAIQQGEYVEEIGGGVSQFATTFFNAAFFGGYEILDHKPHSYYISRYPVGRESTINWPNVDVVIRNDSPYGLLVDTSYTDTSITVTFWGREWVEVDSTTGSPFNTTTPEVEYRTEPSLPPGEERVIQAGGNGFDIVVTRQLRYADGSSDAEEYFTRYLAEPRIIERGPPAADDDGPGGSGQDGGGSDGDDA